jgi:hypothetical protein
MDILLIPVVAPERTEWYVYFQARDGFHLNLAQRAGFTINPLGNGNIAIYPKSPALLQRGSLR